MRKEIKLKVAEAIQDDVNKGIVRIDSTYMHQIDCRPGDIVEIEGERLTVGIADRAYPGDIGLNIIRLDGLIRRNAKTSISDFVTVRKAEVKEAKKVVISPARKGIMIRANPIIFKQGLLGRAVMKGDVVSLGGTRRRRNAMTGSPFFSDVFNMLDENMIGFGLGDLKFVVADSQPKGAAIITENTVVDFNPEAAELKEEKLPEVTYEDIGGLDEEVKKVREMVELPLKHPEIFERLGIEPPKGVLLHGPPGTGKTLLAKAVASETNSNFILINGPEIMCVTGDTKIFTKSGYRDAKNLFAQKGEKIRDDSIQVIELDAPIATIGFKGATVVDSNITHVAKLRAPTYRVTLSDGFAISCSHNQPFLVQRNGEFAWVRLEHLAIGDFVAKAQPSALSEEMQKIYENDNESLLLKQSVQRSDILWESIENIQDFGMQDLYDFTADNDSFAAGPLLLLHNSKYYGQSEENLRKKFEEAEKNAPSIIFIDEIDAIASKREESKGEVERRVVAQLLAIMDGLKTRGKVVVIAATNIPNSLDPALRRPGRFDREIEIGVPGKVGRLNILKIHTRGMPLQGVDLESFADITHGFVGADLSSLVKEAAMNVIRKVMPEIKMGGHNDDDPIPQEILDKLVILQEDFREALKTVRPSALREVLIEVPDVKWTMIGGLSKVKQEIIETVEWPLKNKAAFTRLGIKPPKGLLLYGPPGTGKTLLAKAVATEAQSNFIVVKGPELLSKWVGESEKAVRKIFEKARQTAPTVIFFDEIDSIAPKRGISSDSGVTERVVNQLLTEMDGLQELTDVVIIAATNRPDILDSAILRPGRFDRIILVGAPDIVSRAHIFDIHARLMPIDFDSLAANESALSTDDEIKKIFIEGDKTLQTRAADAAAALIKKASEIEDDSHHARKETVQRETRLLDDKGNVTKEGRFFFQLAKQTEGYVGADIESVCREAAILALRENMDTVSISYPFFLKALEKVRPSVTKDIEEAYAELETTFRKQRAQELKDNKPSYYG